VALKVAKRIYALARQQNEPALMIGGYMALSCTLCFLGDFRTSGKYAVRGVRLWHSRGVQSPVEEVDVAAVSLLCYQGQSEWHRGDIASSQTTLAEATALAKEMNDMHGLAVSLWHEAVFAYYADNPAEVERSASDSIELSTRHHFAHWLPQAEALYGWARAASGDVAEGISRIVKGLQDFRAIGALRGVPFFLALKAEALFFAQRVPDALEAIREAQILVERSEEHWWSAELHRLRGLFLANIGAEETQIEASFCEAIRIAKGQKSVSLTKRAEATYAEYRRQKASGSGGHGFRLPL
jgi:predicted ATPase